MSTPGQPGFTFYHACCIFYRIKLNIDTTQRIPDGSESFFYTSDRYFEYKKTKAEKFPVKEPGLLDAGAKMNWAKVVPESTDCSPCRNIDNGSCHGIGMV